MSRRILSRTGLSLEMSHKRRASKNRLHSKQRVTVFPFREPVFFTPQWSVNWLQHEHVAEEMKLVSSEQEGVILFFHGNELQDGGNNEYEAETLPVAWSLLEIGLVSSKKTLLVDSHMLKTDPALLQKLQEALKNVSIPILVSDVLTHCIELLRLNLTPKDIVDVQLRASHLFPHLRNLPFFDLCEQLLGVYVAPYVYDPKTWQQRPLKPQHLRQAGTGTELTLLLSQAVSDGKAERARINHSQEERLSLIK